MASAGPIFPDHVLFRLGSAPRREDGEDGVVLRGNGCVAKSGPRRRLERERFVVSSLAPRLPLAVPALLDAGTDWILVDDVPDSGGPWADDELHGCLADLAGLHREFVAHPVLRDSRLADPLGRDLDALLADAREAATVVEPSLPAVARLADDPASVVDVLRAEPPTLLHGDPWPPNVCRVGPGRRVWIDWSHAARGPAALDLATWTDQTPWALERDIDLQATVDTYVAASAGGAGRAGAPGDPGRLPAILDAAAAFWLLVVDVPRLARAGGDPALVDEVTAGRRPALRRLGLS